jgi:hypothetical protein
MAYRDVSESLQAYRTRIAAELDEARRARAEAEQRAAKISVLERELAETNTLLGQLGRRPRALPVLENVAVAAPCQANWDEMVGDERVRLCGQCQKNVYNLSELPRAEAEALLAAREGKMCVRFYRRADGTVMTSDCDVGVKRRRRRRAIAGVFGAAATSAALAAAASIAGAPGRHTMGAAKYPVTGAAVVMGEAPARAEDSHEVPPSRGSSTLGKARVRPTGGSNRADPAR